MIKKKNQDEMNRIANKTSCFGTEGDMNVSNPKEVSSLQADVSRQSGGMLANTTVMRTSAVAQTGSSSVSHIASYECE